MKKILIVVVFAAALFFVWKNRFIFQDIRKTLPEIASSPIIQTIKQEVSAPAPLIGNLDAPAFNLTVSGTILWTNKSRQQNGNLPPFKENSKLNQAALLKLQDMFKQQYFEHKNPQGVGPGDLARQVHYLYLSEGENLALGNFESDQALVEAWMDSPGHRANILNAKYTEIGVAVGKGTYEGKTVWMAVQEFGRPASECPTVSEALKQQISALKDGVSSTEAQIKQEKTVIESMGTPTTKQDVEFYNERVNVYNLQVRDYNAKLETLKQVISSYNTQVSAYNDCLEK